MRIIFILAALCFTSYASSASKVQLTKEAYEQVTAIRKIAEIEYIINYLSVPNNNDNFKNAKDLLPTLKLPNNTSVEVAKYNKLDSGMLIITIDDLSKIQCNTLKQAYINKTESNNNHNELTPVVNNEISGSCVGIWFTNKNKIKIFVK